MSAHISRDELSMPHAVESKYQCGEVNMKKNYSLPQIISTPTPRNPAFMSTSKPFTVTSKPQHTNPNPQKIKSRHSRKSRYPWY